MKQILIELDERSVRDLERVAPARERKRTEFIRLAIRTALDRALDRSTGDVYRARPLASEPSATDLTGWDVDNELAMAPSKARGSRRAKGSRKSAA
ncbi:MAG TPA: hypothetical protein VII82_04590 [Polyangiaceae bacterium]